MKNLTLAALLLGSTMLAGCVTNGDDLAPISAAPVVSYDPVPVHTVKIEKAKPVVAKPKKHKTHITAPAVAEPAPVIAPEPTPEPVVAPAPPPPAETKPATFKQRWYHFLRSHGM